MTIVAQLIDVTFGPVSPPPPTPNPTVLREVYNDVSNFFYSITLNKLKRSGGGGVLVASVFLPTKKFNNFIFLIFD